jgi:hypothetical protein
MSQIRRPKVIVIETHTHDEVVVERRVPVVREVPVYLPAPPPPPRAAPRFDLGGVMIASCWTVLFLLVAAGCHQLSIATDSWIPAVPAVILALWGLSGLGLILLHLCGVDVMGEGKR